MSDFLTNRENNRRGSGGERKKPPSESDSLTYRSILNEEPAERSVASNKYRSASKPITSQPMSHESDDNEEEEFHSVKSSHNANLNSFYLAGDADDEDESQRHFKSIHIPTNELTTSTSHNDTADTTRRNSASNNSGNEPMRDSSATIGNSGIELDTVKHKLSSIWNNVKYGIFEFFLSLFNVMYFC